MGRRFPFTARRVGVPLPVEQGLPVQHQRAADLHHHFMPVGAVLPWRPELIGDARAAHHGDTLVDQQQLAVVAVQVAHPAPPVQAIVEAQLHASIDQALAQPEGKRQAAVIIKQAAHLHAALGGQHQRLHHGIGTGPGFDQIQFKIDLLLGPGNAHQHLREETRPVYQQFKLIGAAPREHCAAHVSAP